jgi:hypothetical protein
MMRENQTQHFTKSISVFVGGDFSSKREENKEKREKKKGR